eukprot:scaffold204150_cov34-Tisochrysis_lutea.AAC.3
MRASHEGSANELCARLLEALSPTAAYLDEELDAGRGAAVTKGILSLDRKHGWATRLAVVEATPKYLSVTRLHLTGSDLWAERRALHMRAIDEHVQLAGRGGVHRRVR